MNIAQARRMRGFTLIEIFIAIAILGALVTAVVAAMTSYNRANDRDDLYAVQVRELAVLDRAVREKTRETAYTGPLAVGVNTNLTIATLIAENKLPADFANRFGSTGNSPLGQPYRIVLRKIAAVAGPPAIPEHVTAVIYEDLATQPFLARLERLGLTNSADQIRQVKASVAIRAAAQRLIAGVIEAGGRLVRGPSGGFTKDLSAYFPSNAVVAQAAVLVGFKDLEPADPGGGGLPPGFITIDRCQIAGSTCSPNELCDNTSGGNTYSPATCPAGTTQQGRWPHCNTSQNFAYGIPALGEAMVLGRRTQIDGNSIDCYDYAYRQTGVTEADACAISYQSQQCQGWLQHVNRCQAVFINRSTYQTHRLGGTELHENLCGLEIYFYNPFNAIEPSRSVPTYQQPSAVDLICCQN